VTDSTLQPSIVLDRVSVDLGGRQVLDGVSASVRGGETIAIVGRNGAGKTTLLRAIAGLCPRRGGTITVGGSNVETLSPKARAGRIAFVAQRPTLAAAFTVRETVALGRFAAARQGAEGNTAVADALGRFGLEPFAEREYHELSVGQQQRVSLARAWAQASPTAALLLDEPFAAMDLGEVARSIAVVRAHAARGGAVLAVLHDLAMAHAFATRVWVIDGGTLAADGPTDATLDPARLEGWFGVPFARHALGLTPDLGSRRTLRGP
jgi:iron complex transport system ATP-binding protein